MDDRFRDDLQARVTTDDDGKIRHILHTDVQWQPREVNRLFNFGRAPSDSSLTIGGSAGCSATVPVAGSCPGS
jgi:hypothetical protein